MRRRFGVLMAALALLLVLEACAPRPSPWYDRGGRGDRGSSGPSSED